MKGVIFTEFVEFVEDRFGPELAGQMVAASKVPSGGRYNAAGNYDHDELVRLVNQLGSAQGLPAGTLLRQFGVHLFERFAALYPIFFADADSAFALLGNIETYIHGELRKLYPDAEFPTFECGSNAPGNLQMTYRSERGFGDLAQGLIEGCIAHFGEPIDVQREDLPADRGQLVRFVLQAS